jgi:hypothetical protein
MPSMPPGLSRFFGTPKVRPINLTTHPRNKKKSLTPQNIGVQLFTSIWIFLMQLPSSMGVVLFCLCFAGLASVAWVLCMAWRSPNRSFVGWLSLTLILFVAVVPLFLLHRNPAIAPRAKRWLMGMWITTFGVLMLLLIFPSESPRLERGWGGFNASTYRLSDPQKVSLGVAIESERKAVKLRIYADTPAFNAGLRTDDVVVSINGIAIYKAEELYAGFNESEPGCVLSLQYFPAGPSGKICTTRVVVGRETYLTGKRRYEFRPAFPFLESGLNGLHIQVVDFNRSSRKYGWQVANLWGLYLNSGRTRVLTPLHSEGDGGLYRASVNDLPLPRGWKSDEPEGLFQYCWALKVPFVHVLGGEAILTQELVSPIENEPVTEEICCESHLY